MDVNFNSFVSVSTCDYYGKASCVVFFNECNFRCKYCYNKQTWNSANLTNINNIKKMIKSAVPFVSAITFSGGEPYVQYDALKELIKYSKSLGLWAAIETNGYFTKRIEKTKDILDAIYVDIKAPIYNSKQYHINTSVHDSSERIINTLDTNIPTELRIVDNLNTTEVKNSLKKYNYPIRILPFRK